MIWVLLGLGCTIAGRELAVAFAPLHCTHPPFVAGLQVLMLQARGIFLLNFDYDISKF